MYLTSIICLLLLSSVTQSSPEIPKFTFVEVNPSALDVMVHAFDQVVIYFHNQTQSQQIDLILQPYQEQLAKIQQFFPKDHTLFGHINTSDDFKGVLERYGSKDGFRIINTFHDFNLGQEVDLFELYCQKVHPRLPLQYRNDAIKSQVGYQLLFEYFNTQEILHYNSIFEKIHNFIEQFGVFSYATPKESNIGGLVATLYKEGAKMSSFSLANMTVQQAADQLIQLLNIETLPTLTKLDENNFHRIFGGSVQDQLLFIYKDGPQEQALQKARYSFEKAAYSNRYESLAYERVLFTIVDSKFFSENFNEDIEELFNNSSTDFLIYLTKTNYDRFQLQKYRLQETQLTPENIIQFIQNVRAKRIDPEYKSEPIPSEEEQNALVLRKIVGKSFISEVYEKPDQSILILFIDSKEKDSYSHTKQLLQEFTRNFQQQIKGKLVTAIFDLNLNEHKLLHFKQAPQLILFDRANKKQTNFLKINELTSIEQLKQQVKRMVTNVEWSLSDL